MAEQEDPKADIQPILDADIARGEKSIADFMAGQSLAGGVSLEPDTDPSPTSLLAADPGRRYDKGKFITHGGMGAILSTRDLNIRRTVAMKIVLEGKNAPREKLLRFIEEAQVTGQLEHPNIVPVHELGADAQDNLFYTMKLVHGRTLKQIIDAIRAGDAETIRGHSLPALLLSFLKICDAVAFAHSRGVVHRDLKPENVMLGEYGEVLVMDWGLAKVLPKKVKRLLGKGKNRPSTPAPPPHFAIDSVRWDEGADTLKTLDGAIMGTPGYMAPEQASGDMQHLDERADIYALGAILYTILTLQPPVKGKTVLDFLNKVRSGDIPHPSTYQPKGRAQPSAEAALPHCPGARIPNSLSAVAMKALALRPVDRYHNVKALQKDVEAYQNGFATGAEQAGTWKQLKLLVARHKGVFTALAASLLIIITGSAAFIAKVMASERRAMASERRAVLQQKRAEQAFSDFKDAQKESAPSLVAVAREQIAKKEYKLALSTVVSATAYDSQHAEGWFWVALLRLHTGDFAGSQKAAEEYQRLKPQKWDARTLLRACQKAAQGGLKAVDVSDLVALLTGRGMFAMAAEYGQKREDLVKLYRATIEKAWPGQGGGLSASENELTLRLNPSKEYVVSDLSPLKGIPLTAFVLTSWTKVNDLAPLNGMALTSLNVSYSEVKDLEPLRGAPLRKLDIRATPVSSLVPLSGMPITSLNIAGTQVSDLKPLKGMLLEDLDLDNTKVSDLTPLAGMPITTLTIGDQVADLSPLKGMPLKTLSLRGTKTRDLTPLKGMPLTALSLWCIQVRDLDALKGMPLTSLYVSACPAFDLSSLRGFPLTKLVLNALPITDLTPLKGMPLTSLDISYQMPVKDLSPLGDLPLQWLYFHPQTATDGIGIIRNMKSLHTINNVLAAEFWKKYDAGEFGKPVSK